MPFRRSLIPLALLVAVWGCGDSSPVGIDVPTPSYQRGGRWAAGAPKGSGLLACAQTYDSVTKVIGPAGGLIEVGPHFLWVDSMALADTVSITAVAPADTVRWVRFEPDGLQFRINGAGRAALVYTSFKDCGVPTSELLQIAQVTGSLQVIQYLDSPGPIYVQIKRNPWSRANQYVAGVLRHFSQYAVSW
jgi:hypothetical protein